MKSITPENSAIEGGQVVLADRYATFRFIQAIYIQLKWLIMAESPLC